jgi:hypothetical protein
MDSRRTCLVSMPFTVREVDAHRYADKNHWHEVYEGLISPAIQEAGMRPLRDDKDTGSRLIVEDIWRRSRTLT